MSLTNRTAVYGPVRTVVWEGSGRKAAPYPDFFYRQTPVTRLKRIWRGG